MNNPNSTPPRPVTIAVPIAAAAAVAVNVVLLLIGRAAGASLVAGAQPVGPVQVIIATLMGFALGTGLLWLVARRRPERARPLAWIGLAVAVVSVIAPLTMAADLATGMTLAGMHLTTGIAWFVAVSRRA